MCKLLCFNGPRKSGTSKHDLNYEGNYCMFILQSMCIKMIEVHSVVARECFSPILCNSLLCCVCWPCNSRIWDLTRSRSLRLSCSCGERTKSNKYTCSVCVSAAPKALCSFISQVIMSSALSWESSQPLAKVPAQSSDQNQRENTSSTIICLRSAGDHNSLLSEVGGQTLQPWWATCLASWKSKDLFYFPLYMSERGAPRASL